MLRLLVADFENWKRLRQLAKEALKVMNEPEEKPGSFYI
ncbi:hypothetical protein NU09_1044 [Flavobacterium beibuense]|uniref:Uncharacterized protein n=1 Tax=Flavobacterium beibuense TaxID=657326 RepID=A0A444WFF1_9FLAO|nr:hypothetical protein NU09_1044 [Flavobacterium beibuense]